LNKTLKVQVLTWLIAPANAIIARLFFVDPFLSGPIHV
jgi:hypothetical protein